MTALNLYDVHVGSQSDSFFWVGFLFSSGPIIISHTQFFVSRHEKWKRKRLHHLCLHGTIINHFRHFFISIKFGIVAKCEWVRRLKMCYYLLFVSLLVASIQEVQTRKCVGTGNSCLRASVLLSGHDVFNLSGSSFPRLWFDGTQFSSLCAFDAIPQSIFMNNRQSEDHRISSLIERLAQIWKHAHCSL